ncbi:MAG: SdiA-regulated domain-containing protein [Bacteroidales bacterium]|nr:SdiA-regulated domain-containing protein [Bacteroidales bacterium]
MIAGHFIWITIAVQLIAGCASDGVNPQGIKGKTGYSLTAPDKVYSLPPSLHEISGITAVDAASVACVQDEHGMVFIYDLNKKSMTRQISFGSNGDYEGIARVNKALYILRSDEVLSEIVDFTSAKSPINVYKTGIPGKDAEGLCYDPKNNRLLIAPKEISSDKPSALNTRHIYGFNLASKTLIKGTVMDFDIKKVEEFAVKNNIKVPMKGKKGEEKVPDINLKISAIGIHPLTYKLFAISGPERLLFVFDLKGNLESLERLDKDLFAQPEGITFMENGDMLISNEGAKGIPTIVRFNFRK